MLQNIGSYSTDRKGPELDILIEKYIRNLLCFPRNDILENIVIEMLSCRACDRPFCAQILNRKSKWSLNKQILINDEGIKNLLNKSTIFHSSEENFEEVFVLKKIKILNLNQ